MPSRFRAHLAQFLSSYGIVLVLLLLCVFFTLATVRQDAPTGASGANSVASQLAGLPATDNVVIVIRSDPGDREFKAALEQTLTKQGRPRPPAVEGDPPAVREGLEALQNRGEKIGTIATTAVCKDWALWTNQPTLKGLRLIAPQTERYSLFLTASNLSNIADQIGVIALVAIGMTLVILTGGIDLSVGSLVALSAVTTAWLVQRWGGTAANVPAMLGASLLAITLCGIVGSFSGLMVTRFRIPPFIATLAMMQVASGMAFTVAKGQTIYALPPAITWLGRGTTVGLSNTVWLMLLCYGAAHLFLMRSIPGRNIYAVGGNAQAARLAGVSVPATILLTYIVSGAMAGVGGVILTSQLSAGAPTYGLMYELYVIAAVVVGGTRLIGGEGRILGTLIGAFIIAVIQNGMNLLNVEAYTQKVVLGLVILGAVLLDTLRRRQGQDSA
ncbi:MAG: ABC transporter permease [Armatimonas sp.]